MKKIILSISVALLLGGGGWAFFCFWQSRDIVVPLGVSWQCMGFRLSPDVSISGTEEVEQKDDTSNLHEKRTSEFSFDGEENSSSHVSRREASSGVKAGAGIHVLGVIPIPHAHIGVSGSMSAMEKNVKKDAEAHVRSTEVSKKNRVLENSSQRKTNLERMSSGDYHLRFEVKFRNLDVNDSYRIKASEVKTVSVFVRGPFGELEVPADVERDINVDMEDYTCYFDLVVHEKKLLDELLGYQDEGILNDKLKVIIRGEKFPLLSRRTGKNIFHSMIVYDRVNPSTEIKLSFGPAQRISPWKIKHRRERFFKLAGSDVTIREALQAVNAQIAEEKSMPEQVFEFAPDGSLATVSGNALGTVGPHGRSIVCVEINGNKYFKPIQKRSLDCPLRTIEQLEFSIVNLQEIVDGIAARKPGCLAFRDQIVSVLKGSQDYRVECDIWRARILMASDVDSERIQGVDILRSLADQGTSEAQKNLVETFVSDPQLVKELPGFAKWIKNICTNDRGWLLENPDRSVRLWRALVQNRCVEPLVALIEADCAQRGDGNYTVLMCAAEVGDTNLVAEILKRCNKTEIEFVDDEGFSPLAYAASAGHAEVCRQLLMSGADPNGRVSEKGGSTPIEIAAIKGNASVVDILNGVEAEPRRAPYYAARLPNPDVLRLFVEGRHFNVDSTMAEVGSLLCNACYAGSMGNVKYLIGKGANVNLPIKMGDDMKIPSPIVCAAQAENFEIVDYLLENGVELGDERILELIRSKAKRAMLKLIGDKKVLVDDAVWAACMVGDTNILNAVVIENNVELNRLLQGRRATPLFIAVTNQNSGSIKTLVSLGADPNLKSGEMNPVEAACLIGAVEIYNFFINQCHVNIGDSLRYAIEGKSVPILDFVLKGKGESAALIKNVNTFWTPSGTLLGYAAKSGNVEMADYLINAGADPLCAPKAPDHSRNFTPYDLAVRGDQVQMVKYLVENRHLPYNYCPVLAIFANATNVLSYLIEDRKIGANYRSTPFGDSGTRWFLLSYAADKNRMEICKYLIAHRADVNKQDENCRSPLICAARKGHLEMVRFLVKNGAYVGAAPFHAAVKGQLEVLKYFVEECKFGVNALSPTGWTLMENAAAGGQLDVCKYLVSKGARVIMSKGLFFDDNNSVERVDRNKFPELYDFLSKAAAGIRD